MREFDEYQVNSIHYLDGQYWRVVSRKRARVTFKNDRTNQTKTIRLDKGNSND